MIKPEARADADERLVYDGKPVRRHGNLLNLSTMWQAAGQIPHCRPRDWLATAEAKHLVLHLRKAPPAPPAMMLADIAGLSHLRNIDADFLFASTRGRRRGTWAHWQIALAYAQDLDQPFHDWCQEVVRDRLERPGAASAQTPLLVYLEHQFGHLHDRYDTLERHAADLMFLLTAARELVLGNRRPFSELSQDILRDVVAMQPFAGQCPCCCTRSVLSPNGRLAAGVQHDHFFHHGFNRPEHGWIICGRCHGDLNRGGYLLRFSKMPQFRAFQAAVLAFKQAQRRSSK